MADNFNNEDTTLFLNRLFEQLLQVQKGGWIVHSPKISIEKKRETVVVKLEVEEDESNTTTTIGNGISNCVNGKTCNLCMQLSSSIATLYQHDSFSNIGDDSSIILQNIFQTSSPNDSLENTKYLKFCKRCAEAVLNLHMFYLQWKNAEQEYKETLLRIKYFKRCAQSMQNDVACNGTEVYDSFNDNSSDHFSETLNYDCFRSSEIVENEQNILETSATEIDVENLQMKVKVRNGKTRSKYNNEKPVRRRGGLTEKEYQKHRRNQMARYYQKKKKKTDKPQSEMRSQHGCTMENTETTLPFVKDALEQKTPSKEGLKTKRGKNSTKIRRRGGLTEEEHQQHRRIQMARYYQDKKRRMDRSEGTDVKQMRSCTPENTETTLSFLTTTLEQKTDTKERPKTKKKKYHYKGKIIRRRGGLTENEYQEHRRAQSAHYYLEKKRKLGKLYFGPKPLSAAAKAKLKNAEKTFLDSNKLPARSSSGISVPVISLEVGKRFSYRNVEFTKEDGTHICCKCGHTTKVLNVMKKHIAKIHFDKEHGYKCSWCDKSFYYQFQLRNHEGSHTEKGVGIQCEECGQSFKQSAGYYSHRRIVHQGIKPHECKDCQKQFGTRKDLRKHMESKSHLSKVSNFSENVKTAVEKLSVVESNDVNYYLNGSMEQN